MMRALQYLQPQAPLGVVEVENPVPGTDEVLVEMAYAGLNSMDAQLWLGVGGLRPPTPHVPGVEGSGWVDGRPVLVFGSGTGVRRWGVAAERAVVAKSAIFPVPRDLPLECAAVCGAAGATAMRLFELAEVKAGDCVLVYASAGGIGAMLVSLLANAGVRALGQIRDPGKAEVVRRAGGVPIVAGNPADLTDALGEIVPSVIVDPLGGAWTSVAVERVAVGGRIVSFGALAGPTTIDTLKFYRKCITLRGYSGLEEPEAHARCVASAMEAAADGRMLIAPLLRRYTLDNAIDAFEALRAGARGKIIVDLRSRPD